MKSSYVTRYSAATQALHWMTAIFVVFAFIYGPGGSEERVYSPARDAQRQLHETLGICVLALTGIRLIWRCIDKRPDPAQVPRWMGATARGVQLLLYVLLLAVPFTAISGAWLEGHPLTMLGGIRIPPLIASSHEIGKALASIHSWLGDVILWLAGFHAFAAIYHHLVLKDKVLVSMLPRWLTK